MDRPCMHRRIPHVQTCILALVFLALPSCARPQFGPPGGYGGFGGSGGGFPGSSSGNGFPGFVGDPGFSITTAIHYRTVHGILAAVAMVILFPLGSVLIRAPLGRFGLWVHALFQILTLGVYVAGAGLGIYLVRTVQIPFNGGNLLTNPSTSYHPIIGLVVLATLLVQPILGYVHHRKFAALKRRQLWSYLHIFNGRIAVTVGIINGGLGLQLAGASAYTKKVYIIVAAVIWGIWMLVAIFSELARLRRGRQTAAVAGRRRLRVAAVQSQATESSGKNRRRRRRDTS